MVDTSAPMTAGGSAKATMTLRVETMPDELLLRTPSAVELGEAGELSITFAATDAVAKRPAWTDKHKDIVVVLVKGVGETMIAVDAV